MISKLILGGPGAGKTHYLLSILEEEFERGIRPDRVAFVSFTNKAVDEARERVSRRFNLDPKDMIYCRTLHSLTLRCLGLSGRDVMSQDHLEEFGRYVGCQFSRKSDADPFSGTEGDRAINLYNYARSSCFSLKEAWELAGEELRWHFVKWVAESLEEFKQSNFLIDYSDMLGHYVNQGIPLDIDVAIIDEAQDLSTLQWGAAQKAFANVKRLYISGDPDQAVYRWSGANPEYFRQLVKDPYVLPKSYRLVPEIYKYSQEMIRRVAKRYPVKFQPFPGRDGTVVYHRYLRGIPITDGGSWLLLARNRMFLKEFEEVAKEHGVPYVIRGRRSIPKDDIKAIQDFLALRGGSVINGRRANNVLARSGQKGRFEKNSLIRFNQLGLPDRDWYDVLDGIPFNQRVYYVTAIRRGFDIAADPQVTIDTIHAVKGGEADQVAIMSDMTTKTWQGFRFDPDDEYRVFYVGVTRTRGNLHVVLPSTSKAMRL